jgi:ferric-dicitrate binding protein FerR (iron transport regulator)
MVSANACDMENIDLTKELTAIIVRSAYTGLTPEEQGLLTQYLEASEANRHKYNDLIQAASLQQKLAQYAQKDNNKEIHLQHILQAIHKKPGATPLSYIRKYSWAAAIVGIFLTGVLIIMLYRQKPAATQSHAKAPAPALIVPGKSGAQLTLADGSIIVLDSLGNGTVVNQQGAQVMLKNGQLTYLNAGNTPGEIMYNTLSTPKGREFKVLLPDGTQAWLNSSSSIRYPTQFNNNKRAVDITGEVYFEVATQQTAGKKTPFIVHINTPQGNAGQVEVLGTHFNINAYDNIASTTLLEGRVKVLADTNNQQHKKAVILKPGQQAQVTINDRRIHTQEADVDKVMAWRRGFFNFDDARLDEVMKQLARWYDLDVEYAGEVPAIQFEGELNRQMNLAGVLKALEDTKVHFKLDGRRITILP